MIDLAKYTHYGKFKLHSGQYGDTLYDIKEMIVDDKLPEILDYINTNLDINIFNTIVGIESVGAIIASQVYMNTLDIRLAIVTKNDKLVGKVVEPYLLIDDVVTTGSSIENAIKIIGIQPHKIFCVLDRRPNKENIYGIDVYSIFKV